MTNEQILQVQVNEAWLGLEKVERERDYWMGEAARFKRRLIKSEAAATLLREDIRTLKMVAA